MEATKRCPYCAEEVLAAAIKCKHCGSVLTPGTDLRSVEQEIKRPSAIVRYGGGFLLVCFALAIYASFTSSPEGGTSNDVAAASVAGPPTAPPAPAERPVYQTTAVQLFLDYRKNEVATDERIGDARVEITGGIKSIDKDFLGNPTLKLDIGMDLDSVILTLDKAETAKAGKLSQGDAVRVLCDKVHRIVSEPIATGCSLIYPR
jgi:hypothetical protein